MFKKFDLGRVGLLSTIRPLGHDEPLSKLLLKNVLLERGECSAILPEEFAEERLAQYWSSGFADWLEYVDLNSDQADLFMVGIIRDYFEKNGPGSCCLIEDTDWTKEDYDGWKECSMLDWEDVLFFNDRAYLYLTSPLPDDEKMLDYVSEATRFSYNPSIMFNWPEFQTYISNEKTLDMNALEEISKRCDLIYVTAFDFMSYVIWERKVT